MLRIIQHPTIRRSIAKAFAVTLSFHLRRTIKRIGWSSLVQRGSQGRCPVCRAPRTAVFDQDGQVVMIEHTHPYEVYPAAFCHCGWVSPTPAYDDRGSHNPAWVSQQTIVRIEKRETEVIMAARRAEPTYRLSRS